MNVASSDSQTAGPVAVCDESLTTSIKPPHFSSTSQICVFATPPRRAVQSANADLPGIPLGTLVGIRDLPICSNPTFRASNDRICIPDIDTPDNVGDRSRTNNIAPSGPASVSPSLLEVSSIRLKPRPRKRRDNDCSRLRKSYSHPFIQYDKTATSSCENELLFSSFLKAIKNDNDTEAKPTFVPPGEVMGQRTSLEITRPRPIRQELNESTGESGRCPLMTMNGKLSASFSSAFAGKVVK